MSRKSAIFAAMKRTVRYLLSMLVIFAWSTLTVKGQQPADTLGVFHTDSIMHHAERVAAYFMRITPDVGANSYVGGKQRNSKIWTRGVFYEGLLNMYRQNPRADWLQYAIDWGDYHQWVSSSDNEAKSDNADYQCCGQSYLELYNLDNTQTIRMEHIKMRIDGMMAKDKINQWTWIDAIQMSMPIFAQLGTITGDSRYWQRMYDMYQYTRNKQGGEKKGGGKPLFNTQTGLWYRDYQYDPPYKDKTEPDKDCYWSRGNGWVYMALVRVLQFAPGDESHRADYVNDYLLMSRALKDCQRQDGSWNVSLAAPSNYGQAGSEGPEMTGSSLFVGGLAYGVRTGLLDSTTYLPTIRRGWYAMRRALHDDTGFVGYLQGTGAQPEDGGVITYNSVPNFEDFGIGCWLWGAAEVYELAQQIETDITLGIDNHVVDTPQHMSGDDPSAQPYFNLQGLRVLNPQHGHIYIKGGRKILY